MPIQLKSVCVYEKNNNSTITKSVSAFFAVAFVKYVLSSQANTQYNRIVIVKSTQFYVFASTLICVLVLKYTYTKEWEKNRLLVIYTDVPN